MRHTMKIFTACAIAALATASNAEARSRIADGGPVTYLTSGNGWLYNEVDLRNNAQCDRADGPCAIPIGFKLGSNVFRFNGAAIDNSRDMIFRFRNGALVGGN